MNNQDRLILDKEQLNSLVNSCQEEIRRLKEENQRLNNVLNELENYIKNSMQLYYGDIYITYKEILDKLKKLKESDKQMNEEKYMKNGVFSLEYDKETLKDMVLELQEQLKAYENMRKEMLEIINYYGITPEQNDNVILRHILKDLLNILNKVGGSDE